MVAVAHFLKQAQNNAWANGVLGDAVAQLSEQNFAAARPGFFGSILRTLNHIYEVDLYYIDALEGAGLGRSVYQREDIANAAQLSAAQSQQDNRLIAFCAGLTEAQLSAECQTERQGGVMVAERTDWLLLHLFQHQVHHRGQVHTMLSHAGIDPPQLDDFFLIHGRVPSAQSYWS